MGYLNKIYAPLIETVANGPLRRTVFTKDGYPDISMKYWNLLQANQVPYYNECNPGDPIIGWHLNQGGAPSAVVQNILGPFYDINTRNPHVTDIMALFNFYCPDNSYGVAPGIPVPNWAESASYTNPPVVFNLFNTSNNALTPALEQRIANFWRSIVFMYTYVKSYQIVMSYLEYCRRYDYFENWRNDIDIIRSSIVNFETHIDTSFTNYAKYMTKHLLIKYPYVMCYNKIIDSLNLQNAIILVKVRITTLAGFVTADHKNTTIELTKSLRIIGGQPIAGAIADIHEFRNYDEQFSAIYGSLNGYAAAVPVVPPERLAWNAGIAVAPTVHLTNMHNLAFNDFARANALSESYIATMDVDRKYSLDILHCTLSKAMYKVLTTDVKNTKRYIIQSLSEVPLRIKEEMKAFLPVFNNLFKAIAKNASFVKHLCKILPVGCFAPEHNNLFPIGFKYCKYYQSTLHSEIPELYPHDIDKYKNNFMGTIDMIINASLSFSSSIENIIGDLNDTPLYMETSDNSMLKYKNRNNQIPFTPISSMLYACKEYNTDDQFGAFNYGTGDSNFMFSYGIRGLIHDYNTIPVFERMPGVKHIMDNYNIASANYSVIEDKTYEYYVKNIIGLFRFIYSTNIYSFMSGGNVYISGNDNRAEYISYYDNSNQYLPYQMYQTSNINEVVALSTSEDYVKSSGYISDAVSLAGQRVNSRKSIALHNIADLEICPIDLHAMRREIPLINIMNYSHACDRMITDIVNKGSSTSGMTYQSNNPIGMYLRLCRDPYVSITNQEFITHFRDIAMTDVALGKSRYLQNQLWCKVLMQESRGDNLVDGKNKEYPIQTNLLPSFKAAGFSRFNTKIMRDDIFHVLLHKTILYAMNKELTNVMFPVINGNAIASDLIINRGPDDDITFVDI